jgi:hypothetical protein
VARLNAFDFQIFGSILSNFVSKELTSLAVPYSSELEEFSSEILEYGGNVYSCPGPNF